MTLYHTSLLPVNTAVMELVGGPPLSIMGGPLAAPGYKLRHLGVAAEQELGADLEGTLHGRGAPLRWNRKQRLHGFVGAPGAGLPLVGAAGKAWPAGARL